ncbi:MAG: transcription termination/antitermination protein NusA, partial [Acidimicrobiaceae bacterium]|nr:transcription termination/antitermination protein NusA [Acidimicrobiaceae bacterium]
KEGQNARLAARLTGWRIDIKSETQLAEEEAGISYEDDVEYEEGEWVANKDTGTMEFHSADGSILSAEAWEDGGTDEPGAAADKPEGEPPPAAPPGVSHDNP